MPFYFLVQICLFYLVLRGLDTIEDDMSIPEDIKQSLLRHFHEYTVTPGWTFKGSGPKEKDRQLLVEYDTVVEEVNRLAPEYGSYVSFTVSYSPNVYSQIQVCHP
jgi:farnesyl-diphosphate farnesyltransferase